MANLASLHAIVYGHVQGVFFRAFVHQHASRLNLAGYVRNLPGGKEVEVQAEGEKEHLEKLVEYLKTGPPNAGVIKVATEWEEFTGRYSRFKIQY